ncbi:carbohydrate-binding module family 20 domain-containing protein [Halopiger xanaduensis]|uniref:carbohydrate-binding module family 20 domain-containing protein n=1 Tax=Halopiger xanaduensis TaxID=387343 RepID=UPI000677737C|nr:carbohydrate-binding module family 20 domain-containing protein [Halopiger xanaduensis]
MPIAELGNWEPTEATEAFHAPEYPDWFLPASVPTDTTLEFKFIKIADDGTVTWESGDNRTFTTSADPNGVVDTPSYDFRS